MLDPVIGRDEEINRVIRILSRKRKNNPILIGDAGVGKTAIVEGLAQCIVKKQVPDVLTESRVLALDMAAIVAGTKYRGEFEERLKRIVEEIKSAKNIIIFIDEVHSIIGAGAAEGAIDAANILKPALARGELQCIGATTINEYKMYIEKDTALVRRFQSVLVEEPDVNETIEILHGLKGRYELHHKVKYDEEALVKAAVLADRYISDRALPDKAIDLLDEAGAMARLSNHDRPIDIVVLEEEIEALNKGKNELVLSQEYEKAAAIRDQINEKREVLAVKLVDWQERRNDYVVRVGVEEIAEIISESTGIPAESLDEGESKKLLTMENELHQKIIGQDDAIVAISKAIRRARVGLSSYDRPKGTFLFLGPTGVGKTELAKVLAEFLFNDEKNLIRLDMSEYMEKHSVSRLIGAPPGYIGYEEGGQLTEKVRRRPYSVILLDEIEKAHPDVYNILLQIFEEGDLTDGSGLTVNFRETIIIITSNIGNREYQKMGRLGFSNYEPGIDSNNDKVTEELRKTFNPELLNRLDSVIFFHKLTREHIRDIIDLMLEEINERLKDRELILDFTPALKKHILEKGFDDRYGARNLRRVIQNEIEDTIASEFLTGCYDKASKIQVSFKKDKITLKIVKLDPAEVDTGHDENSGDPDHSEKIITNGHTH
jgi:ATP-dependent Clp protease ATP-binding subunit ClpC